MTRCIHFGVFLGEERRRRGIRLWKFAANIPFPQSNIQRMERGNAEPRVGLAVRMVHALGVDVGEFMAAFLSEQDWGDSPLAPPGDPSSDSLRLALPAENISLVSGSPAAIFGFLLKRARLANNLNQMKLAETSGYTVRSLISVEKGRQEPMITNALRLVWATGCPPENFFNTYSMVLRQ